MKKKVLSALLAVALFVGLAVPAFADFPISSESGDEEKITSLAFKQTSYAIAEDGHVELADELIAYVGDSKIAQYPTIEWSISENDALTIDNNGKVEAIYSKGSATVTAKADNGKKATVKVTAKAANVKYATGWKFVNTKNTLISKSSAQNVGYVEIAPTPAGSVFSTDQIAQITEAVKASDGEGALGVPNVAKPTQVVTEDTDTHNLKIEYAVTPGATTSKDVTIAMGNALKKAGENAYYPAYVRTTKLAVVAEVPAEKIVKTGSITVEIGQTVDLNKYVAYGPSKANTGKSIVSAAIAPYDDNAEAVDYAVIDGEKILGVAVGKCKAVVSGPNGTTTTINVNVVKRGATSLVEPTLSSTEATLEVGGTTYITVKNPNADADYEWTVDNDNCTIVPGTDGEAVKIFAKKVGTSKVTCYAGNVEIGTITVTVKAADTTAPTAPGATTNPQTGDSIFAGLF